MNLRLDWATHASARMACEKWHYRRKIPVFKTVKIGVWEDGSFVGVVVFGCGSTPEIAKPFGMTRQQVCELVRVALREHKSEVSKILSISVKMLRKQSPFLRLIVSFADSREGHHGGIYQAAGWIYVGSSSTHTYKVFGQEVHPKTLHGKYGVGGQSVSWLRSHVDPSAQRVETPPKHKYVMPLDSDARILVENMRLPYPKRAGSSDSGTSPVQGEGGGSIPTPALSSSDLSP